MEKKREIGWNSFEPGIQIFVFGLFKKLVLADRLSVFVNQVYKTPLAFGSMTVFFAAVAYSLQIYFDFSGYSDMAVGIAKILGFTLPKNFNLPYLSHNVTEFWKRWHITLSTWLQDYLYISLGGSRKGRKRTYLNLLLTMLLGGIWHGANWTFLAWGGGHAVALSIHKVWMRVTKSDQEKSSGIASGISIVITFLYVTFLWIFFRAESLSQAVLIIRRIFEFRKGLEQPYLWLFVSLVLLAVCSILAYQKSKSSDRGLIKKNVSVVCGYYPLVNLSEFWGLVWFFVFCGSLICLAYTGGSPFIYGQY
jgi:alginate O-acetyltransferase complex protein AlgI